MSSWGRGGGRGRVHACPATGHCDQAQLTPLPRPCFPRHGGLRLHSLRRSSFLQHSFSFMPQASHPASSADTDPHLSSLVSPSPEATAFGRGWSEATVGTGNWNRL